MESIHLTWRFQERWKRRLLASGRIAAQDASARAAATGAKSNLATIQRLAFMPIELLLQVRLSFGSFCQMHQGNFELPAAQLADSDRGSGTQPFDDLELPFWHGRLSIPECELGLPVPLKFMPRAISLGDSLVQTWIPASTIVNRATFRCVYAWQCD
jgi:hypothetical protein